MDMKQGIMANHFKNIMLKEAIIDKYRSNGPSIFRQIKTKTPIDGIWISKEIHITQGGYLNFDLISSTDHQCLWVDISFALLLGHKMPPFPSPKTWHLHCRDPWIVNNYVRKFEKLAKQHHLLEKVKNLDAVVHYPINSELIYQYETLDATQCEITIAAEQKCRKLRKGQVAFSPELQLASNKIRAYIFLIKRKKGEKLSSMQLARTLRKAGLLSELRGAEREQLELSLKLSDQKYYQVKKDHLQLRASHLEQLAEALADEHKIPAATALRQFQERETQRSIARKLRYLRGKMRSGSTMMVTVESDTGTLHDITKRRLWRMP
jgi:hypothetical protein